MSPKLGRWTGLGAVIALVLVTAAVTTLVNQAFFVPADFAAADSAAAASSQADSRPDSGQAEIDRGAANDSPDPVEIESGAAVPGAVTTAATDAASDSGESQIDSAPGDEEEPGAAEPRSDSGEAEPGVEAAVGGHSHSAQSESPKPAPKLCVIADGDADKLYWRFIEFHAGRASKLVGVHLHYSNHPDAADRVRAIEACAQDGVPMILATLADPQVIVPALRAAAQQGVRIASFGWGAEHADDAGSLVHVSMDDPAAARRAAEQFASAGISGEVLCLIPDGVEDARRQICDELQENYAGGLVDTHQLTELDPGGQIVDLLAAAPETAGMLVLEADLLPQAIEAMENTGISPVLGSIGEFPLSKLPFAQRDQIAFTVMDLARFEVLLAAATLRLMHTYHPNARFFEGAMIFEGQPNVHTGGARGGHERPSGGEDPGHGNDGHDHNHDHGSTEDGEGHH